MNRANYEKILKKLNVDIVDGNIMINQVRIPATVENMVRLFDVMTEFSVTAEDKDLIAKYYGLEDNPQTLGELSEMFGKSDERIREIIQSSMRKIAHRLNKQRSYNRIIQEVSDETTIDG